MCARKMRPPARHSRPTPILLCHVSRQSDDGQSRVFSLGEGPRSSSSCSSGRRRRSPRDCRRSRLLSPPKNRRAISARTRRITRTDPGVRFESVVLEDSATMCGPSRAGTPVKSAPHLQILTAGSRGVNAPRGARLGSDSASRRGVVHATVHHRPTPEGRHKAPPFQRASDGSTAEVALLRRGEQASPLEMRRSSVQRLIAPKPR